MAKISMTAKEESITEATEEQNEPKPMSPKGMLKQKFPGLGSIEEIRKEIDDAFADMREFHTMEPDQVMQICSAHRSRLSEIRVRIQRMEDVVRILKSVRTREVEPAIEELKEQFNIASRLLSVRQLDWEMEKGY